MTELFAVYAIDSYYPYGGVEDFEAIFTTVEEAEKFIQEHKISGDYVGVQRLAPFVNETSHRSTPRKPEYKDVPNE